MADNSVRPAPTQEDAALARRLMAEASTATLAVIDGHGLPYAALTAPGLTDDGVPLVLASDLAAHGRALRDDGRASLLYAGQVDPTGPLKTARLTIQGRAATALPEDRAAYLARRPDAELYIDFGDMQLYRVEPSRAQLVAGFGRAVALSRQELLHGS